MYNTRWYWQFKIKSNEVIKAINKAAEKENIWYVNFLRKIWISSATPYLWKNKEKAEISKKVYDILKKIIDIDKYIIKK